MLDLSDPDILERSNRLRKYLLEKTYLKKMTLLADPAGFLSSQINALLVSAVGN